MKVFAITLFVIFAVSAAFLGLLCIVWTAQGDNPAYPELAAAFVRVTKAVARLSIISALLAGASYLSATWLGWNGELS